MKKIRLLIFTFLVFLISISGIKAANNQSCVYIYEPINRDKVIDVIYLSADIYNEISAYAREWMVSNVSDIIGNVFGNGDYLESYVLSDEDYDELKTKISSKIDQINAILKSLSDTISYSNPNYVKSREEYEIGLYTNGNEGVITSIKYRYNNNYIDQAKLEKYPKISLPEKIDLSNFFEELKVLSADKDNLLLGLEKIKSYKIDYTNNDKEHHDNRRLINLYFKPANENREEVYKSIFNQLNLLYDDNTTVDFYDFFVNLLKTSYRGISESGKFASDGLFTGVESIDTPEQHLRVNGETDTCPTYLVIDSQTGEWRVGSSNEFTLILYTASGGSVVENSQCYNYKNESSCKRSVGTGQIACVWNKNENSPNGGYCNVDNLLYVSCGDAGDIPYQIPSIISLLVNMLKIATPLILIFVSVITLIKALAASKEDEIKKAQSSLIKKIIAAAMVFFVVSIVQFVVSKVASASEKTGFSDCLSCFLNNKCEENAYYKEVVNGSDVCINLSTGKGVACPVKLEK